MSGDVVTPERIAELRVVVRADVDLPPTPALALLDTAEAYLTLRAAVEELADEMGAAYTFDQWDSLCIRLRAALADQGGQS